ncbi:MAG: oligosaccharide flippase family protein [Candidatus Cloacimonetes bacterium]|nr:oligosaccharide flippase family protein [Candidatus Cloacimonadota bacterium]
MSLNIRRNIKSARFRQIISLYGATLLSIVLGVGVSKLNTHLLTPLEYGNLKYIEKIFVIGTTILSFGLFTTIKSLIPRISSSARKGRFLGASLVILLAVSGILTLCLIGFAFIQPLLFEQDLRWFLLISSFLAIAIAGERFLQSVLTGDNEIQKLSLFRLLPRILNIVFILPFLWFFTFNVTYAWFAKLIGILIAFIIIYAGLRPRFGGLRTNVNLILRHNKTFGLHIYTGALFGVLSGQLAVVFISYFTRDNTYVGYFSLANMTTMPLMLVPSIVGETFFKDFARSKCIKKKILSSTVLISSFTLVLFFLTIKPVMLLLFGQEFAIAADLARILVIGKILYGFADIFNRFLSAHRMGKYIRNSAIMTGIVSFLGNVFAIKLLGVNGAVLTVVAAGSTYLMMCIYYYRKFIRTSATPPGP